LEQLERRELMAGLEADTSSLEPKLGDSQLTEWGPVRPIRLPALTDPYAQPGLGEITAEIVQGVLKIRGDAGRNFVTLHSSYISYNGIRINPGSQKYNGEYQQSPGFDHRKLNFANVTAIDIDLGDGDDEVWITEEPTMPQLTIRTGDGNDKIVLKGILIGAITHVWPPNPNPFTPIPLRIAGDLFIDTGAGDDELYPWAYVEGDATIMMGDGDDSFIETSHDLHHVVIHPGPRFEQLRHHGKLTASGEISIDLGAGQDVENIPADWRDDADLVNSANNVPGVLEFYRGMVDRGEDTPGVPQIIDPPTTIFSAKVDAEGRLEIDFLFEPGFGRVIDRLKARGVLLDAYSVASGRGRALVREEDLKLFANLPGRWHLSAHPYPRSGDSSNFYLEYAIDWDYIRPGSSTEAEAREAAANLPPAFGPPRPTDAPRQNDSLLDSYYRGKSLGPQRLS
jgi:hypothetical protein